MSPVPMELDFIEELKLRRWARENYRPAAQRQPTWHAVVHDEMTKKDRELNEADEPLTLASL